LVGAAQEAELSANVGWASEYFYRGVLQKPSSASVGLDLAVSKVYLGTWAADVGDGNEVDVYAGVGTEVDDFRFSVGGTGYFYTDDAFDQTYLEGNFNAGYGPISGEFSYGRHMATAGDEDYWFLAATVEQWGLYATFGTFGKDLDGEYYEGGYSLSVGDLDLSAAWIYSTEDLIGADAHTIVFGISHTFGIDIN
jgi:uncharacterized protein (TIGR02001 family)